MPDQKVVILHVDDDEANRYAVTRSLTRAGFVVDEAANGSTALQKVAQRPDLIILDVRLPDIDGFEVCRRIKGDPLTAGIPVLHLSASAVTSEDKAYGLDGGADGYLIRPVEPVELVATVNALLRTKRAEAALEAANASIEASAAAAEAARDTAEAANRAKDSFLAVLSHELRTPLMPVVMAVAELEHHPDLPDDVRETMSMIRRNIDLETRLIDDLLDLSRVVSGKLRLRMEQTSLHDVLRHAYEVSASDLNTKRLKINWELSASNDRVIGDPTRLQQVFWNLMKNAIKFSPEGRQITVRTSDSGPGRVRVEVADNGLGITPQALPHIFGAFDQGDARTAHQFGGLGLGLAISRAVVDMHGGTITAASSGVGRGATLTVEMDTTALIPTAAQNKKPSEDACKDPVACRVLLVEDHPDSARLMGRLLGASGYIVSVAHSVASALKLAAAGPFDIVISDIGLPDATGYDLMRRLKADYGLRGIAVTGYGMDDDLRQGREAGFLDHVTKPVSLAQLEAAIQRVLGQHVRQPSSKR